MGGSSRTRCPWLVQAQLGSRFDWRDPAAYAALLGADRSLFAWEWLRRDPQYLAAARSAQPQLFGFEEPAAERFGLVAFEHPGRGVPEARPLWRSAIHPPVLAVEPGTGAAEDIFLLERLSRYSTLVAGAEREHLLLSDGLRSIRIDSPAGTFGTAPVCLRYLLRGVASASEPLLTLQRLLALLRTGGFARSLHPQEPRARRWILILRARDALSAGASQRQIAEGLLSSSVAEPRWRSREPSVRLQAQRLVSCATRLGNNGYRSFLTSAKRDRKRVGDPRLTF